MATKAVQYVEFDVSLLPVGHEPERVVKIYGFDEQRLGPREIKPVSFKGRVGEIEGYGQPYDDLFKEGSLTQGEAWRLFNAYLSARRGLWKPTPEQAKYLNHLFDRVGYGNILETVIDFDSGDRSKPANEGSRRVLQINRPELLVVENGIIKEVKGGERKPKNWPANGYVGRTCDGAYDEDGVPIKTWPRREQAEATWPQDTKENREFAQDAVSYAYARNEGGGKAVVLRGFFDRGGGRFGLCAGGGPWGGDDGIGRSPASR